MGTGKDDHLTAEMSKEIIFLISIFYKVLVKTLKREDF